MCWVWSGSGIACNCVNTESNVMKHHEEQNDFVREILAVNFSTILAALFM
jgi:hypothetical protein